MNDKYESRESLYVKLQSVFNTGLMSEMSVAIQKAEDVVDAALAAFRAAQPLTGVTPERR